MTTSEIANLEQQEKKQTLVIGENLSVESVQKKLFTFKVIEYLLLAAFFSAVIVLIFGSSVPSMPKT